MLDEEEFASVQGKFNECTQSIKKFREDNGTSITETPIDVIMGPLRQEYERLTGVYETNHNAIMHHRILIYGPLCEQCGKPLRTPLASFCAACGKVPEAHLFR